MRKLMPALLVTSIGIKEIQDQVLILKQTRIEKFNPVRIIGIEAFPVLKISRCNLYKSKNRGTTPYSFGKVMFYFVVLAIEPSMKINFLRTLQSICHD